MTDTYSRKPLKVQAVKFTYNNKDSVYNWAKSIQGNVYHGWDYMGRPILKIPTLEGEMICDIGDWIIVEPFPTDWRKLYPCKGEIFEKTYESESVGDDVVKRVKDRLHYHFKRIDGEWDVPDGMPFMKEFLNEVEALCSSRQPEIDAMKKRVEELEGENKSLKMAQVMTDAEVKEFNEQQSNHP